MITHQPIFTKDFDYIVYSASATLVLICNSPTPRGRFQSCVSMVNQCGGLGTVVLCLVAFVSQMTGLVSVLVQTLSRQNQIFPVVISVFALAEEAILCYQPFTFM